jgi:hypothetical protein
VLNFGYSRYGIFLEVLGGYLSVIFLLRIFTEKKIILLKIVSIFFVMYVILQGFNIIFFNLKNDYSFRPHYTYKQILDKLSNPLTITKYTNIPINVRQELNQVKFVVQCTQSSSVYVATIKELKKLPIINLEHASMNAGLVNNEFYSKKRMDNFFETPNKNPIRFAILLKHNNVSGELNQSKEQCIKSLNAEKKFTVDTDYIIDNFVGDSNHQITIMLGNYYP